MREVVLILPTLAAAVALLAGAPAGTARAQAEMELEGAPDPLYRGQPNYPPGYYPTAPMIETEPMETGSIAAPPISAFPEYPGQTWIGYCAGRYPDYDPRSNTYRGPDGRPYLCR